MGGVMGLDASAAVKRWALGICACTLVVIGLSAGLQAGESAAARRCAPVVTKTGPGLTQASVLIVTGRADCEKSRKVIFEALSTVFYKNRLVKGWHCASTDKGRSGVYGAQCTNEGEKGEEVIRSTVPQRCPGCDKPRD
jgi:hypothetical protein